MNIACRRGGARAAQHARVPADIWPSGLAAVHQTQLVKKYAWCLRCHALQTLTLSPGSFGVCRASPPMNHVINDVAFGEPNNCSSGSTWARSRMIKSTAYRRLIVFGRSNIFFCARLHVAYAKCSIRRHFLSRVLALRGNVPRTARVLLAQP
jgi:hypothetical protein